MISDQLMISEAADIVTKDTDVAFHLIFTLEQL